ncbi:hypothetical protein H9I48_03195 [Wolbachia pipientis]|uniref:hypothetical protein n=1 Tax=Wolbachia pipientis TaxID=955 RepID=UPI001651AC40|nr:hypothetical protein [Wolbachia pipientis]MBC6686236.1 hypothetical protein [Wolbachia pipientis]
MLAEAKVVKDEIELFVKGNKKITLKAYRSFFVGLNIKSSNNNTKELFVSGSYKEGRYIIEQVVAKERSFTSFEEMKRQLDINEQPSIGNICEYPEEEFTDLPEVSKKEAEKKNGKLQAKLNTAKKKRRNSETKIKTLNAQIEEQKQQVEEKAEINKLNAQIRQLQATLNLAAARLQAKDEEINELNAQIQWFQATPNDDAQLKAKDEKIIELEAKNKTTEQPKQGNGAKYTATVGMGLAAGLIAFTALERTVRLEMLVMIGIAVASALVAGGITYAALPSTQVDGVKAQEVNENGKSK